MGASEELRAAVAARSSASGSAPEALAAARAVKAIGGDAVAAVLFFGSRQTQAGPDPHSAWDFFVVTRGYAPFYRALRRVGASHRPARLLSFLNALLTPSQVSLELPAPDGATLRAKCAVVSLRDLRREASVRRRDHFILGRLFQPVAILLADASEQETVLDALVEACRLTVGWVRPWLPERFTADEYCRTLLRVSYGAEIRPEPVERRIDTLWAAQQERMLPVYSVLLRDLAREGELVETGAGTYALARPAGAGERRRLAAYFAWSRVRATTRWAKHVVTFEGWLDYIRRKAERHTGQEIVLTPRERRLPLVFLWPRVLRYLRHKDR
ncbi:MAG TPA: hypothetical protein VGN09_08140 [Vicinamibacteria bacterium]|jgi:hypothetical protein